MTKRGLLFGASALLAGCGAADMVTGIRQGLHFFVVNDRLLMRGEVIGRTPAAFADVLDQNAQVTTLVLQDMRGTHDAAAVRKMGYNIRKRGLATALQSDSAVHGAAVELFLGGKPRRMVAGAEIGLTMAHTSEGQRQYLRDMLGSDGFYEFALQTAPSDGIYIMTEHEISQHGLLTAPIERLN